MKRKYLMAAVAIGTASMMMLSGCSLMSYLDKQDQASGPINHRDDDDERQDEREDTTETTENVADTTEMTENVADTTDVAADTDSVPAGEEGEDPGNNVTESADNGTVAESSTEEVVLSFDPADRPNANSGYGSIKALEAGDIAPDFTVELTNGGTFTLSDHDDGVVLINVWATWCGPCVGEMPELQELAHDGIDKFDLVCINCGDDKNTVDSFVKEQGFDFNIAYDVDYTVCDYYPTDYIPYTVIVKNGIVCETYVGAPADAYEAYKSEVLKYMDQ